MKSTPTKRAVSMVKPIEDRVRKLIAVWAVALVAALAAEAWAEDPPIEITGTEVAPTQSADYPVGQTKGEAAEPIAEGSVGPVAKVPEPEHHFEDVWVNETLEHSFNVLNTGDAPLQIVKVKPSCGCTVAGKHPSEILPGESGSFPFRISTNKIQGKFTKAITVTTNDPANKDLRLTLSGEVKQYIDMDPRVAQFSRIKADEVKTEKLTLTNNTDEPLELTMPEGQLTGCFKAELAEVEAGKKFELTVTAQPPFETGINRAMLNIETNIEKQKQINVTCMATMPTRLELRPDKIQVAPTAKTESIRRIWFTNNGDNEVNITKASATDEALAVETRQIEAGRRFQISVTIPPGYSPASDETAVVLVTDDAERPELRIPILATKRQPPQPRERPAMTMVGQNAPVHSVATYGGGEFKIGGESDKVQVLTFYASWCGFCKRALPTIEAMHEQFTEGAKDATVIAINLDGRSGPRARTEEQTIEHYKTMQLSMPLVLDAEKQVGNDFKVSSFPTMVVVGKSGVIEAVHVGAMQDLDKIIATEVDLLLAGKTRADFPGADATARAGATPDTEIVLEQSSQAAPAPVADEPDSESKARIERIKLEQSEGGSGR